MWDGEHGGDTMIVIGTHIRATVAVVLGLVGLLCGIGPQYRSSGEDSLNI
jgi:hypothetical protein